MIGAKQIEISSEDLIGGMTSSPYLMDGGFSNESFGMNLSNTPGLVYAQGAITNKSTNLATGRSIIASSEDPTPLTATIVRLMVDDGGNFYTWDGSTLTDVHTDATNPTQYVPGITDMIGFADVYGSAGTVFVTNRKAIVSWVIGSTITDAFYAFANQNGSPHPGLIYNNNAYYGDGNLLLRQSSPGGTPTVILTLAAQQTIVALGIDPGSGQMLISTVDGLNYSGALNKVNIIQYYDGVSPQVSKQVICDDMVTSFHPVGGVLYITYGQNLGYWSGSGIKFLRTLNIQLSGTNLAYKQHLAHIDTTLYVAEGTKILAYGNIIRSKAPVFYYPFTASGSLSTISAIMNLGSGLLGYAGVTGASVASFFTADMLQVSSTGQGLNLFTLRYPFSRPVVVNQLIIEFGTPFGGGTFGGSVFLIDDNQVQNPLTLTGLASAYQIQSSFISISTRSVQIRYILNVQIPIRRMTILYSDTDGHI